MSLPPLLYAWWQQPLEGNIWGTSSPSYAENTPWAEGKMGNKKEGAEEWKEEREIANSRKWESHFLGLSCKCPSYLRAFTREKLLVRLRVRKLNSGWGVYCICRSTHFSWLFPFFNLGSFWAPGARGHRPRRKFSNPNEMSSNLHFRGEIEVSGRKKHDSRLFFASHSGVILVPFVSGFLLFRFCSINN